MDKKITIVCGKNPLSGRSGYASYAYNLAVILNNLGCEVTIVTCGKNAVIVKSKIGKVNMVKSNWLNIPGVADREMVLLPILCWQMAKWIRKQKGNGVIWGVGPWALTGVMAGLKTWTDCFTSIKHEAWGGVKSELSWDLVLAYVTLIPLYSWLEGLVLRRSDRLISHYISTEEIISRQFNISKNKFVRLPYQVLSSNIKFPRNSKLTLNSIPLVLTVCRHDPRKGIKYLLNAYKILNDQGIKYRAVIIGAGKLHERHIKLAKKLELDNVEMPGFVKDLSYYFKAASVFAFASVEEGSSALSVLEAMKMKLPIVCTNVDGIPEDIEAGKSGILVPAQNPAALALGIKRLLGDQKLARSLGCNARARYERLYGRTKVIREVGRFLKQPD